MANRLCGSDSELSASGSKAECCSTAASTRSTGAHSSGSGVGTGGTRLRAASCGRPPGRPTSSVDASVVAVCAVLLPAAVLDVLLPLVTHVTAAVLLAVLRLDEHGRLPLRLGATATPSAPPDDGSGSSASSAFSAPELKSS